MRGASVARPGALAPRAPAPRAPHARRSTLGLVIQDNVLFLPSILGYLLSALQVRGRPRHGGRCANLPELVAVGGRVEKCVG